MYYGQCRQKRCWDRQTFYAKVDTPHKKQFGEAARLGLSKMVPTCVRTAPTTATRHIRSKPLGEASLACRSLLYHLQPPAHVHHATHQGTHAPPLQPTPSVQPTRCACFAQAAPHVISRHTFMVLPTSWPLHFLHVGTLHARSAIPQCHALG
jgi:hypothetical protein